MMIKQIALGMLGIMLISSLVSAESETVNLGNYTVSFDLGLPKDTHNVAVKDPEKSETLSGDLQTTYSAVVTNKTGITDMLALVLIASQKPSPAIPSGSELRMLLPTMVNQMGLGSYNNSNLETATRAVDGTEGAVGSFDWNVGYGIVKKFYVLVYFPTNDLCVVVGSTFPWDNTLNFLKTVHVVKQK